MYDVEVFAQEQCFHISCDHRYVEHSDQICPKLTKDQHYQKVSCARTTIIIAIGSEVNKSDY